MDELKIEEVGGVGDNLRASLGYKGGVQIEVEEPWSGDTETGFGRSGAIQLTWEQALSLAQWLVRAAAIRHKEE